MFSSTIPGTNPKVRPKMIRKDNAVCASLSDAIVKEQGRPDYQTTARTQTEETRNPPDQTNRATSANFSQKGLAETAGEPRRRWVPYRTHIPTMSTPIHPAVTSSPPTLWT
jgi:hypothetical protein